MYEFDTIIDRRGTDSLKHDFAEKFGKPADVLPLWVADMDFKSPPAVLDALAERVRHGVFGYSDASNQDYFNALSKWYETRFGWNIRNEWLIKTPGVVFALCAAIQALTREGEAVIIQQPVYYPFQGVVKTNKRKLIVNQLVFKDGKYSMDIHEFERLIIENDVKLFILCSPHNPVGRVWTKDELIALGDICVKHGVLVISDEIHADFVYPGHSHIIFAGLKPEYADITVTCTAPTKTFNLAGLQISNIFVKNDEIRRLISREIWRSGYSDPNLMGLIACQAAYESGAEWLQELKAYLYSNLEYVRKFLEKELPLIRLVEPEGTYLIWLDCHALGLSDSELDELIVNKAGLWLDAGTMFGAGGEGFQRINIACPQTVLKQAMEKLKFAVDSISR